MMFFPFGFKLWLIGIGAFMLGLFGLYRGVKKSGRDEAYREVDAARQISRKQAAEISRELDIMDDQGLANAARKWTRNTQHTRTREKTNDE